MNLTSRRRVSWAAFACAAWWGVSSLAQAQAQAPQPDADTSLSHSSAQSEAGEPRASTSPDAAAANEGQTAAEGRDGRETAQPGPHSRAEKGAKAQGVRKAEGGKAAAVDKLQLQTATVTGDREQPKVMYIVPWKRSDIGDLSGKPMNSLLDEALAPVDRDEFKREVMYYQAIRVDASQSGAAAKGAAAAPSR